MAKMARMQRATGKQRAVVIRSAMDLFTQSVVKATPPLTKARDCQTLKKRRIIPVSEEECQTFQSFVSNPRNRVKNPHAFWEYIQANWPKNHPWRNGYKIHFNKARNRSTRIYPKMSQARKHQRIDYRNLGKYTWISAMALAGVPTKAKRPSGQGVMVAQASRISAGKGPRDGRQIFVSAWLQSKAIGIGRYAKYAVAQALRKTNTRLKHALRAAERKVARA